jgi:RimJ/RimL family protein N-acetyltransferase
MTILITDRLTLTPVQSSDLPDLCALWGDPVFAATIFPRPCRPRTSGSACCATSVTGRSRATAIWSIRETATGDYVGSVGVLDYRRILVPAFDAPELGWGVARASGTGALFEALSAALGWCDEALNAPRTVCMISPGNASSLALVARATLCRDHLQGRAGVAGTDSPLKPLT